MNQYRITFTSLRGHPIVTVIEAETEAEARELFLAQYDGRIITIEEIKL